MTPGQAAALKWFAPNEWKHPDLVNYGFAIFLDEVRQTYGKPLILTSDARTPEENAAASGHSSTSLHLVGCAVDLHWTFTAEDLFDLVAAVLRIANGRALELELVNSAVDKHVHIGLFPDPKHPSTLIVAAD